MFTEVQETESFVLGSVARLSRLLHDHVTDSIHNGSKCTPNFLLRFCFGNRADKQSSIWLGDVNNHSSSPVRAYSQKRDLDKPLQKTMTVYMLKRQIGYLTQMLKPKRASIFVVKPPINNYSGNEINEQNHLRHCTYHYLYNSEGTNKEEDELRIWNKTGTCFFFKIPKKFNAEKHSSLKGLFFPPRQYDKKTSRKRHKSVPRLRLKKSERTSKSGGILFWKN